MSWFNPQEQEERDYHPQNEFQLAYEWSKMNRKPDDAGKIQEAVAAGKFVIVEEGPDYCPVTDAVMGSRKYLASVHETREDAETALAGMFGEDGPDPDISVYILPHKPAPPYTPPGDDDIPF